jgi:hypothetical protein
MTILGGTITDCLVYNCIDSFYTEGTSYGLDTPGDFSNN